jgi:uncharacterized protein DUF4058
MPLRDHFRSPVNDRTSWDGFHGMWPAMIVQALSPRLPANYVALPRVHLGSQIEIDVATFENDELTSWNSGDQSHGGVTSAVWAPPQPTLSVATDSPDLDEYEVRIYDTDRGRQLVAAIEIVSPANKDRLDHRRAFVAKCSALLQSQVAVSIVDLVTTREFNLYCELLESLGQSDPSLGANPPSMYATACRWIKRNRNWLLETWAHKLTLGQTLPSLPLWLADDFAVPLELEPCYEDTCRILRIP